MKNTAQLANKGYGFVTNTVGKISGIKNNKINKSEESSTKTIESAFNNAIKNSAKSVAKDIVDALKHRDNLKQAESNFDKIKKEYDKAYVEGNTEKLTKLSKELDDAYDTYNELLDKYGYYF